MKEVIHRFGLPQRIDSDKETHFTSKIPQQLSKVLEIDWKLNVPYHPHWSGQVERMNGTIKEEHQELRPMQYLYGSLVYHTPIHYGVDETVVLIVVCTFL